MAINPRCDKCGLELKDFGGLLFSPPDDKNNVKKFHICRECCQNLIREFERL